MSAPADPNQGPYPNQSQRLTGPPQGHADSAYMGSQGYQGSPQGYRGPQDYQGPPQDYRGPQQPLQPPVKTNSRWFTKKRVLLPVVLFLGVWMGSLGGSNAATTATPTATATVTAAGPTATVTEPGKAGATVTEKAAPAATVTAPAKPAATVTVTEKAPAPKAEPEPQSDSLAALEDGGTLKVGEDVQPGSYKAKTDEDGNCYWARLKDSDGDDIIANDWVTSGSVRLTIKKSDKYVQTSGCTGWKRA